MAPAPWSPEHIELMLAVLNRVTEEVVELVLEEQTRLIQNLRGEVSIPVRIKQVRPPDRPTHSLTHSLTHLAPAPPR